MTTRPRLRFRSNLSVRRRLRTKGIALPLVVALVVATGGGAYAAFTAIKSNTSTVASSSDWLPPVVKASVIATTSGVSGEHIKNGSSYYVYADVVADRGNPATGITSVTADASGLTSGQTAVALTSGSYTHDGVAYNYRSASLAANTSPGACRYTAQVTASDAATPVNRAGGQALAPLTDRDLLTDYNIRLDGPTAGDGVGGAPNGVTIAGAGDVNNDGLDDVIVGNKLADINGTDAGSAYVIFGRATSAAIDLASVGSNGFQLNGGAAGDNAGKSVAGAGDVNSDGYDDVIVSAQYADNNGTDSGAAYVVFGSASPTTVNLGSLAATAGYRIDGGTGSYTGTAVGNAGDVNGDGKPDAVIGASAVGQAYVVFGKTDGGAVNVTSFASYSPAKGYLIQGPGSDVLGEAVGSAGDVNSDGKADILVGAPYADYNSRINSGSVYLIYGQATSTAVDVSTYTSGFRIDGATDTAITGFAVSGAGDVNADGRPDILLAAQVLYAGGASSGAAYVVFGKTSTSSIDLASLGSGGYQLAGGAASDYVQAVAGIGDVNGDGKADAFVAAKGVDVPGGRTDAGSGYVIFGKADTTTIDLASVGTKGYLVQGAAAGDGAGEVVANAGDFNGDGRVDFLIGAPGADNNSRSNSGSAYVVHGPHCGTPTYTNRVRGTPGLLGHWPLNERSGTTASDTNGGLNNGTYVNAPTLGATGAIRGDKAVTFDGTNDYVNLGNPTNFQRNAGSVEAWIKTTNAGSSWRGIAVKKGAFGLYLLDGVLAVNDFATGNTRSTDVNLADGRWHHVAMTFTSGVTSGLKIYIDGVLARTATMTVSYQTEPLTVAYNGSGTGLYFAGTIDEPAIYDRVLEPGEIAQHYGRGVDEGPTGYWRLSESSGTTAYDVMGANNGTYTGAPTLAAGGPISGDDKAVTFDGADDELDLGNPAAFQATTGTIEAWVKTTSPGAGTRGIMNKPGAYGMFLFDGVFGAWDWGGNGMLSTGVNVADGKWHHVAMSYRSGVSNGTKLYVDGVLRLTATSTFSDAAGWDLRVATNSSAGNNQLLAGSIDEPAIYDRVLTQSELADHYYARGDVRCSSTAAYNAAVSCTSGLIHYWRLGETSGTTAVDSTGSANGTYTNGVTLGTAGPLTNDLDSAVTTDGSDDTVDLPGVNVNTAAGAVNTVEFWMYYNGADANTAFSFSNGYCLMAVNGVFGFYTSGMWGTTQTGIAAQWVHVVAQFYNGDPTRSRLWIDGAERTLSQNFGTSTSMSATSSAYLAGYAGTVNYKFAGKLDDVTIYNRALSTSEILAHYEAR